MVVVHCTKQLYQKFDILKMSLCFLYEMVLILVSTQNLGVVITGCRKLDKYQMNSKVCDECVIRLTHTLDSFHCLIFVKATHYFGS